MNLISLRRVLLLAAIFILSIASAMGCSRTQPTASNPDEALRQETSGDVPSFGNPGHACWGMWQFMVDRANRTVDIVPLRSVSFHLNALPYLEPPPLTKLNIDWSTLDLNPGKNTLDVDVLIQHPFPGLNEFTGFDVRGILITDGDTSLYQKANDVGEKFAAYREPRLANADGLTRWWNPVEFLGTDIFGFKPGGLLGTPGGAGVFSATLNGYKYFCQGLGPGDPMGAFDPASRGNFPAGGTLSRHYTIDFGKNHADFLIFNYAVDASWQLPSPVPPQHIPEDFPITANSPEPFWIETQVLTNELYYAPAINSSGGRLEMMITVHDWQNVSGISAVYLDNPKVFTELIPCEPQPITDNHMRQFYVNTELTGNISDSDPKDIIIVATTADTTYQQNGMVEFYGPPQAKVSAYQRLTLNLASAPTVHLAQELSTLLPMPQPFTIEKDFAVIGAPDKAGVYYFGQGYTIYRYPLDYSAPGELYDTLEGYMNYSADDLWEFPIRLSRIDMNQSGEYVLFSNSTGPGILPPYLKRDFGYVFDSANDPYGRGPIQGVSTGPDTGIMKVIDVSATTNFAHDDCVFWIYADDDVEPSEPQPWITVPLLYYRFPYTGDLVNGDIGAISGSPVPAGPGLGEVDPSSLKAFAVCGMPFTAEFLETDITCAFLEGPPYNDIEIFNINCNDSSDYSNQYVTTITEVAGSPKDIEIFPAKAGGLDVENDWVVILEQGLANETLVEVFSLDGTKIDTSDIYTGQPISVDIDPYNYRIHIWFYDTLIIGNPVRAVVFDFNL